MATPGTYAFLDDMNLIGLFDQHYEAALNSNFSLGIGMPMPSNSETEDYGWLGAAPSLEELKSDDISLDGFNKFTYSLRNKEYAKGLLIKEKDRRRDKLGMLDKRIAEFAQKAAEHWDVLTATLLLNGATAGYTSYDGVTYFAATHAESGTNQVNALTSSHVSSLDVTTATAPTADEMAAIIPKVLGKFFLLTDDKGDPMNGNAKSFTILTGSETIWGSTLHALKANNLTSGASNPAVSVVSEGYSFKVVLTPRLSAATSKFYVLRNDSPVKPLILQEEVAIRPSMTDDSSDQFKLYRRYVMSLYTSRAAGYGRWQSAMQCTLS